MSQELVIFALRIGILAILYLFLAQIAVLILRDLRSSPSRRTGEVVKDFLVVVEGNVADLAAGDAVPLEKANSLGRAPGNAIQLMDDFVSARHAVLSYDDESWWIEDLGSTNGTLVNGKPVKKPTKIMPGDMIQIGLTKLRLNSR